MTKRLSPFQYPFRFFNLVFIGALTAAYSCTGNPPVAAAVVQAANWPLPYDLSVPTATFVLEAPFLQEISGLGPTAQDQVFCAVADEAGEIFLLDMRQKAAVQKRIFFKDKGDFEGVEMVGDTLYAIKSDSKLFEITGWKNDAPKVQVIEAGLDKDNDIEGLCYDPKRRALLIACKEDPEKNVVRNVWAFDLKTRKKSDKPVFSIQPDQIDALLPLGEEDKMRHFSPSGIAIHPISGDVYIISSALKRLVVLDYKTGAVKTAVRIDKEVIGQPEGIAFDAKGQMFISSEAKNGPAAIYAFAMKNNKQ